MSEENGNNKEAPNAENANAESAEAVKWTTTRDDTAKTDEVKKVRVFDMFSIFQIENEGAASFVKNLAARIGHQSITSADMKEYVKSEAAKRDKNAMCVMQSCGRHIVPIFNYFRTAAQKVNVASGRVGEVMSSTDTDAFVVLTKRVAKDFLEATDELVFNIRHGLARPIDKHNSGVSFDEPHHTDKIWKTLDEIDWGEDYGVEYDRKLILLHKFIKDHFDRLSVVDYDLESMYIIGFTSSEYVDEREADNICL